MTKDDQDFVAVPIRLDEATAARIDALVLRLSKDGPVTESEVLRRVLLAALNKAETDPEQLAVQLREKR